MIFTIGTNNKAKIQGFIHMSMLCPEDSQC